MQKNFSKRRENESKNVHNTRTLAIGQFFEQIRIFLGIQRFLFCGGGLGMKASSSTLKIVINSDCFINIHRDNECGFPDEFN